MTWTEAENLAGNSPVMLSDGAFGLLIQWDRDTETLGVQVFGEDDIRWIPVRDLTDLGNGALKQVSH